MKLPTKTARWPTFLCAILLGHILWGSIRIPGRVYGRRMDNIERYLESGAPAYHLGNNHRQGARIIEKLLAETSPDAVILWRGEWKGCVEFVPLLIAPRLLVEDWRVPADARQFLDRPIARGELAPGLAGSFVLIGLGDSLDLELR